MNTIYDFDVAPYLNWKYDRSCYGQETWKLQQSYDQKFKIAQQLAAVRSIVEINCGFLYMNRVFNSAICPSHYLGLDNNNHILEQATKQLETWEAMRQSFSLESAKGYSRIRTWNNKSIPSGSVDLVFIHGVDYHETTHHLKCANKIGSWLWVTNTNNTDVKKAVEDWITNNKVLDTFWYETRDGECIISVEPFKTIQLAGDVGDIMAGLSVFSYFNDCNYNFVLRNYTRERMTDKKLDTFRRLLEEQDYIGEVKFFEDDSAIDGDIWRNEAKWATSIADSFAEAFSAPIGLTFLPWLECDKAEVSPVIFCRSPRFHASDIMWRKLWQRYPNAYFCGMKEEWEDIQKYCPGIPWHETKDFLELAEALNGAKIVCCNQSAPYWVSAALGKDIVLEIDNRWNNCRIARKNIIYIGDDNAVALDTPYDLCFNAHEFFLQ